MHQLARLAVIVPAHNCERTIVRTLRSIDEQSLRASVVIVVDDCSTDDTSAILLAYQAMMPELKIVQLSSNRGAGSARQAGINSASDAEFVAFLDSDDEWHPDHLKRSLEVLRSQPAAGATFSNAIMIGEHKQRWSNIETSSVRPLTFRELMATNPVVQSTVVARRESLQRAGGYREGMRFAEDFDLWMRLISICEMMWMAAPHSHRYTSASQLSRQRRRMIEGNWAAVAQFEAWGLRYLSADKMRQFQGLLNVHLDSDMRFARADWDRSLHEIIINGAAALVYQSPRLGYWRLWLRWVWPSLATLRTLYALLPARLRSATRAVRSRAASEQTTHEVHETE